MPDSPSQRTPQGWGCAAGVLAFSAITLSGMTLGLQPETILLRATAGGALVALGVLTVALVIQTAMTPSDKD